MGPLVPPLLLTPNLGGFAYLFRDFAVVGGVPTFSAFFVVGIGIFTVRYLLHYARFAKDDPDRLQSEKFRLGMEQLEVQRVLAKDGVFPQGALEPPSPNPAVPDGDTRTASDDERPEER